MECKCIYCGETIPEELPMCWRYAKNIRLGMEYRQNRKQTFDYNAKTKDQAIKDYEEKKKNDTERSN